MTSVGVRVRHFSRAFCARKPALSLPKGGDCELRHSPASRLPRSRLVVRRIHHHRPPWSLAIALRSQISLLAQRQMHHPPLPRRHRSKLVRRPSLPHLLSRDRRQHPRLFQPQRPLVLAVERNLLVLHGRQPQNFHRQQFQRPQQFSAPVQQQRGGRPREVHQNFRLLPIPILRQRRIHRDPILNSQSPMRNHRTKKFVNLISSSEFVHKVSS